MVLEMADETKEYASLGFLSRFRLKYGEDGRKNSLDFAFWTLATLLFTVSRFGIFDFTSF